MNELQICSEKFERQLDEIKNYISSLKILRNVIGELVRLEKNDSSGEARHTLEYSKVLKNIIETPIQYNAVIISLYGSFEQFIDEIFNEYCRALYEIIDDYDKIPFRMREKHIKRLGEFLANPQRYKNYELTEKQAIENALVAFENPKEGLQKNQSLLLAHGGNLKVEQIAELANGLGVGGLEKKIVSNYGFKNYIMNKEEYADETYESIAARESKKLFVILNKLVDSRNDVAHGWVENRIDFSALSEEYIEYLKVFSETLKEILMSDIMCKKYEAGKLCSMGKPKKVIDHHIACINNGKALLKNGDNILAIKDNSRKMLKIQSIERNKKNIPQILEHNIDIG